MAKAQMLQKNEGFFEPEFVGLISDDHQGFS